MPSEPPADSGAPAVPDGSAMGPYGFFRDNRPLCTTLSVLLTALPVIDLAIGILSGIDLRRLSTPEGVAHFLSPNLDALDVIMMIVGLGYLIVASITIPLFFAWKNRSCKNAWFLAPHRMSITPPWTVIWYFVPFAQLVKPLDAMKEVIEVSIPDDPPMKLADLWWTLLISALVIYTIIFIISIQAAMSEGVELVRLTIWLSLVATPINMASSLSLLVLIRRITRSQLRQIGQA